MPASRTRAMGSSQFMGDGEIPGQRREGAL